MRNKLLIFIFIFIIICPKLASLLNIKEPSLNENRVLNSKPPFTFSKNYSKGFTNYFNDRFGLRNYFIIADRYFRYKFFNISTNSAVSIGKDHWLFYTPDTQYIDSVNGQPFSQDDLIQIKNNLLDIQTAFQKQNIKFYFLVAPNKQSIYPEFLPNHMKKVHPDSRLDQIDNFLKNYPQINFINPKSDLLVAKNQNQIYLKYDTHWNQLGAFVAYQKLFKKINQDFPNLNPKNINDFTLSTSIAPNKDLALELGVAGQFSESSIFVNPKIQNATTISQDCPEIYTKCPLIVQENSNKKLPRLLMFRDSFAVSLIPFISEHFQHSYYYWGQVPFPNSLIKQEKPNIIIFELTERELWRLKDQIFSLN